VSGVAATGSSATDRAARTAVRIVEIGGLLTIWLSGDLDVTAPRELHEAMRLARWYHAGEVIIDCSAVTFIDSSGLDALLALVLVTRNCGQVTLRQPTPMLLRMLDATKTTLVFNTVVTV
jgi:anti-anti-sigma factor